MLDSGRTGRADYHGVRGSDDRLSGRGSACAWGLTRGVKLREAWGKLRRLFLVHFAPGYVRRQVGRRRGACRRCGSCCRLLFRCPHLVGANVCRVYDRRYLQCRLFPIDARDLAEVGGGCGFWFEDEG